MAALAPVAYEDDGVTLTGWLALPQGQPRAAIVVFPTIANVTSAIERRAAMLAEAGFMAMIADFYGQPDLSFKTAQPLAEALRRDVGRYRQRLLAGLATLRDLPSARGLPLAAVGYCMGGQAALEVARSGAAIAAAVSFHGLLGTDLRATPATPLPSRLLVCHGDDDPLAPPADVLAFNQEMAAARANLHFHSYSGVRHGFTDPGSDARGLPAIAYDASADRQSWAAMISLFDELFPSSS